MPIRGRNPNDDRRDARRYEIDRFSPTRGRPPAGRRCLNGAPRPAEPRLPLAPPAAGPHAPPVGAGETDDVTGDAGRLLAAFQPHAAAVYRVAHRLLGDPADAEEVRQQLFADLLAGPAVLNGVTNVRAYLCRCAANAAANRVRSAARRRRRDAQALPPTSPPPPGAAAEAADEAARLWAALKNLTPAQREVLSLRFDAGLTLTETASALSIPVGTAKDRSRSALARLRVLLSAPSPPR